MRVYESVVEGRNGLSEGDSALISWACIEVRERRCELPVRAAIVYQNGSVINTELVDDGVAGSGWFNRASVGGHHLATKLGRDKGGREVRFKATTTTNWPPTIQRCL